MVALVFGILVFPGKMPHCLAFKCSNQCKSNHNPKLRFLQYFSQKTRINYITTDLFYWKDISSKRFAVEVRMIASSLVYRKIISLIILNKNEQRGTVGKEEQWVQRNIGL